jgi:hypothetical protein
MKTIISFNLFPVGTTKIKERMSSELPLELYERISAIYPDGRGLRSIRVVLPEEDDRLIRIRDLLRVNGYSEESPKFKNPELSKPITMNAEIEYEANDFGKHEWYQITPWLGASDYATRDSQGRIDNIGQRDYALTKEEVNAWRSGGGDPRHKVPPQIATTVALAPPFALISGVDFLERALGKGYRIPVKPTTVVDILEWCPEMIFPTLSAACLFCDPEGRPVSTSEPRLCGHLVDGIFGSPLLKYDKAVVQQWLNGARVDDIAWTRERFGITVRSAGNFLLLSRRLTEWIISTDERIKWEPVLLI